MPRNQDDTILSALLGPTNTGKTHYAMDRMASYRTGMIGFPLRLLARENYDRLVSVKGAHKVALVTGEEKIIPSQAQYYICTVEAMPLSLSVEFLCIDEIQLCADAERGHIFTHRLLHARGEEETLFLGSSVMTDIIKTLLPRCRIETRERMSPLEYTGHKKVTRLPPRSAVVAFNISDVYRLAELVRAQRGGTAIVLGALSPRTRNAQVSLYQNGDVDYLVATDAIGMGLNLDINHVALAATRKFDGLRPRRLRSDEIAQIAGRAGRFRSPGTFGVTDDVTELDPQLVQDVENHRFDPVAHLRWRSADLEFKNGEHLLKSLSRPPPSDLFVSARQADDHQALIALMQKPDIRDKAMARDMTHLLWDVCAIPDFRKTLTDDHPKLLEQIFRYLSAPPHHLPEDWIAENIARLDRVEGDIDTLLTRIAYTRTWTYVTHVKNWLRDSAHWQAVTRQIEDRLSDALHERLTQRFIDKRAAGLLRGLSGRDKLLAGVQADGTVVVEGHAIGRLRGWHFMIDETVTDADKDAVMRAARTVLAAPLQKAVTDFTAEDEAALSLSDTGRVLWQIGDDKHPVAALAKGADFYNPKIRLLHADLLDDAQNKVLQQKIESWLAAQWRKTLGGLLDLEKTEVKGVAKGIAFQVYEAGGVLARTHVDALLKSMDKDERRVLGNLGLKLGAFYLYHRDSLKPAAMQSRAALYRSLHGLKAETTPLPQAGNVSMACPDGADRDFYAAMGLPVYGRTCVRVDMVERLNSAVFDQAVEGKYKFDPALASTIGVGVETVQDILRELGFRYEDVTAEAPAPVESSENEQPAADQAVSNVTRYYFLKRHAPRKAEAKPEKKSFADNRRDKKGKPKDKPQDRKTSTPMPDKPKIHSGHNPFAALAALKKSDS